MRFSKLFAQEVWKPCPNAFSPFFLPSECNRSAITQNSHPSQGTHLEVVRQLCTASIARVHSDEHATRGLHFDDPALKVKGGLLALEGILNGQQLLSHHGQHLYVV